MPIPGTDVAATVRRNAAAVNDDAKNDESNNGDDFDHAKNEFNFADAVALAMKI